MCSDGATSGKARLLPVSPLRNPPQGGRIIRRRRGGVGGGVTYGIWRAWIRFCSWLQQWDDSFRRVVLSHLCFEGKTWSRRGSFSEKEKNITERERNGGMRKQSSKRQQNDWACHIFFVCFHLQIRKIRQYKCKSVAQEGSWEGLNTPRVSLFSVRICFFSSNGTSFTFSTAIPFNIHPQIVACSVSNANKTTVDKINKANKRKYSSSQMRYLCIALCQKNKRRKLKIK